MAVRQGELALERKEAGGDEVEALPAGWCWSTLGELIPSPRSKVPPDPESVLPFVGMDHIEPDSFEITGRDEFRNMKSAGSAFSVGDVLYGRLRPYLNKVHKARFEGVASAEFIVLPAASTHDSDFLKYLLHQMAFVQFANEQSSGDRPRVKFDAISGFQFPLPPLAEQRRIVDRIDELFSRIEAGERAVAAARAGLKRYRKALLKAAVTGALTEDWRANYPPEETAEALLARILQERRAAWEAAEIAKLKAKGKPATGKALTALRQKYKPPAEPDADGLPDLSEGWVWATVDHLCPDDTGNEISVAGSLEPPGIPALRLDAITEIGFDYSKRRYIQISKEKADKMAIRAGHLYVSRANGSKTLIGRAILAKEPPELIVYPDTIIRFGIILGWAEWLNAIWPSHIVRGFLEDKAKTSAGIWKIAQSDIKPMPIPLPPAAEQAEIVSRVEEALSRAEAAEAALEAQTRAARALKQSILKAAFTGKLVPQNPNDEPASELLKRVKKNGAD